MLPGVVAPDQRFTLANERTFLAWNRTALALIAGGLAIEQFLEAGRAARLALSLPVIVLGAAISLASYSRWRANEEAMSRGADLPPSRMPGLVAACFGVMSIAAVVFAIVHAL
jgi:putative membrane protein